MSRRTPGWDRPERMPDGCLEWRGRVDRDGYGRFDNRLVHRAAYAASKGDPTGRVVCHSCDNPACFEPDHLFLGDPKINGVDSALKGRARNQHGGQHQTHCKHGHEYTPENTYWRPGRAAQRDCRQCIRDRVANYKRRKGAA